MRFISKLTTLVCALSLVGLLFTSCDDDDNKTVETPDVAVSLKNPSNGWRSALAYYTKSFLDDIGVKYLYQTATTGSEQGEQLYDISKTTPRVLIVVPEDGLVADSINNVIQRQIPVILGEQELSGVTDYAAAVLFDNNLVGQEAAKFIHEKAATTVLVFSVAQDPGSSDPRINSFEIQLKELNPDVIIDTIEIASYTRDNGKSGMVAALKARKESGSQEKYDAVFAQDDEVALGVLDAIQDAEDAEVENIKAIVGCGGAQAYFKVIQSEESIDMATTLYSPRSLMEKCIDIANQMLGGKTFSKERIVLPAEIVDKNNVDNYIDSSSPY